MFQMFIRLFRTSIVPPIDLLQPQAGLQTMQAEVIFSYAPDPPARGLPGGEVEESLSKNGCRGDETEAVP